MSDRYAGYVGDRASLLDGTTVAHTDIQAHKILIGPPAPLIDWAGDGRRRGCTAV